MYLHRFEDKVLFCRSKFCSHLAQRYLGVSYSIYLLL